MAASQCPKCGHLFEVRDGSGEPLPLAHCTSCDAYYPAHVESCKWCGTALVPEKARKGDFDRLKWIAAGTFAVAVLLGLLARDPGPKPATRSRASAQPKVKAASPVDTAPPVVAVAPMPHAAPTYAADAGETVGAVTPVVTDVSSPAPSAPASAEPAVVPQGRDASSPPATTPEITPHHATSTNAARMRRASSPWVSMVARQWAIVRADADRSAHIVASVGPNSRVQLGEARGSWRRIKLRGIAGWVDVSAASFVAPRGSARRARRVAGRQ